MFERLEVYQKAVDLDDNARPGHIHLADAALRGDEDIR